MEIQKSRKGRLSAAEATREVPAPRGHRRKGPVDRSDVGSPKAAARLRRKTGRQPT